jgi:hypothetical protein
MTAAHIKEAVANAADARLERIRALGIVLWHDIECDGDTDRFIKGLIGEKSLVVFAGATGSAKTFIALDASFHLAAEREWFGRKVTRCGVLYVGAEGQAGLKKRVAALRDHHGIGETAEVPFALYPAPIDLTTDDDGVKKIIEMVELLRGLWGIATWLVVIDTLARCFGSADESSTRDMNTFVTRCDAIRIGANATVLVVHHFGKDESKGMRGSIALKAAADTVVEIIGTEGVRTARVEKQKDGAAGEAFSFKLQPVELGQDEDGNPVSSCVVIPSEIAPEEKSARAPRLPPAARIAKESLQKAIAEAGSLIPASNHVPANTIGVPIDLWRRYAYQRSITNGETDSARRKAFSRAAEVLQANRAVNVWTDWAWIP